MKFETHLQWITAVRDYRNKTVRIWIEKRLTHRVDQFTGLGLKVVPGARGGEGMILAGPFTPELHELLTDCFGFPSEQQIDTRRTLAHTRRTAAAAAAAAVTFAPEAAAAAAA